MDELQNGAKTPACETGVVEGFFGPPWSHEGRRRMIRFMADAGFATYIYAPKDDVFHRENWIAPYPLMEWEELLATIKVCGDCGVEFVWAVSPGLTIRYSNDRDFELLIAKFERIVGQGVRTFCLFLDDIPPTLVQNEDKERFKSLGSAHVFLTNRLHDKLVSMKPDARLWFCPTEYATVTASPYLETIGEGMRPEIGIFWTGAKVVPPAITADDARAFAAIIRRKPLLWDNYPVNDYNRKKLNMGPLRGRDPELPELLQGYFANPMNEPVASTIPLMTAMDYLRDPKNYDPEKSWVAAIRKFGGHNGWRALLDFCDAWPAGFFKDEPPSKLQTAFKDAETGKTDELGEMLDRIMDLQESMQMYPELRDLVAENMSFVKGIVRYAYAAHIAIVLRQQPGNPAIANLLERAFKRARRTETQPGGMVLEKFIADSLKMAGK